MTNSKSHISLTRCCGLTVFKQFFGVYKNIFRHTQKCLDSVFRLHNHKFLLDNYIKNLNFTHNKNYSPRLTHFRLERKMNYNILKPNVTHTFNFNIQSRFSLTQFTDCIFRTSLTSMLVHIDINYLQPLTPPTTQAGSRNIMTTITNIKHFSGLTATCKQIACLGRSSERYQQNLGQNRISF